MTASCGRETGREASVALVDGDDQLTYAEFATRVADRGDLLDLADRSVVVLAGDRSIEFVVAYLAVLEHGHVPLLAGDHVEDLAVAWDAAAVIDATRESLDITRRRHAAATIHPGSRALVEHLGLHREPQARSAVARQSVQQRLGDRRVPRSPRAEIAASPRCRSTTATGCRCCTRICWSAPRWRCAMRRSSIRASSDALERHSITNVAGVPHTFDLLDRAGPDRLFVPSLRFVTQAGGRLQPEAVRRWITRSETRGVDFYVMYGQTEATARMAYLRPEDRHALPDRASAAPIPGGSFSLRPVDGRADDVGELIYRGPNVMLGYAERPEDLALGRTIDELATGDLARYDPVGDVYEIVGRSSRFVKPFGVRVDLDAFESWLRDDARRRRRGRGGRHRRTADHRRDRSGSRRRWPPWCVTTPGCRPGR